MVIVSDWDCERGRTCLIGTRGTMLFKEYEKVPVLCKNTAWYRCPSGLGRHSNCSVWQYTLPGVCADLNCEGMWKLLPSSWLTQCRKLLPEEPCPQTTTPACSLLAAPPPLQWASAAGDTWHSVLQAQHCIWDALSPLEEMELLQNY